MKTVLAWHFTGSTLRGGRPIPPIGEALVHEGQIEPCVSGLHASSEPWDALAYAPGEMLHRVEMSGEIVEHGKPADKIAGRKRRIIASVDATQLLRRFAANQALSVAHLWVMPPDVREYLETLDEAKRAAARDAASAAAWSAARDAARDAAWPAAWAAARDAASAAAWSAARSAARPAAWAAARREFNRRVYVAFGMEGSTCGATDAAGSGS